MKLSLINQYGKMSCAVEGRSEKCRNSNGTFFLRFAVFFVRIESRQPETDGRDMEEMVMKLIVGLGNPGRDYAGTRHNVGFGVITRLADEYHIPLGGREHKAVCGKGMIGGEKVILAQPQTFMNLSGESVQSLAGYYKIECEDIIVAYDDIDLEVGQIRVRAKGSAGGHNGMKNIIAHLGTNVFPRVKVGVGAKPEGGDLVRHVLGRFSREEEKKISEALDLAVEAVEMIVSDSVDAAMNRFNAKRK